MKQPFLIFIILLTLTSCSGSEDSVSMRVNNHISIKESTVTAAIADKYPITMGLEFEEIQCYEDLGFVSGWYVYDKYQKKIPLIGRYNDGFFELFQFTPKRHAALMQAFRNNTLALAELGNAEKYLERFEVIHPWTEPDGSVTERLGSWSNGDKTLTLTQFEWKSEFEPQNNFELVINNTQSELHRLDLLQAIGQEDDFRVTNGNQACSHLTLSVNEVARTKAGWNVLVDFAKESRSCWGDNSGYFSLHLDESYQVINSNGYITYVCDERSSELDESSAGTEEQGQRYLVMAEQDETSQTPKVIGSFFIKNAAVMVESPWPNMTP